MIDMGVLGSSPIFQNDIPGNRVEFDTVFNYLAPVLEALLIQSVLRLFGILAPAWDERFIIILILRLLWGDIVSVSGERLGWPESFTPSWYRPAESEGKYKIDQRNSEHVFNLPKCTNPASTSIWGQSSSSSWTTFKWCRGHPVSYSLL